MEQSQNTGAMVIRQLLSESCSQWSRAEGYDTVDCLLHLHSLLGHSERRTAGGAFHRRIQPQGPCVWNDLASIQNRHRLFLCLYRWAGKGPRERANHGLCGASTWHLRTATSDLIARTASAYRSCCDDCTALQVRADFALPGCALSLSCKTWVRDCCHTFSLPQATLLHHTYREEACMCACPAIAGPVINVSDPRAATT